LKPVRKANGFFDRLSNKVFLTLEIGFDKSIE
jgi:hypothetical protein